MCIAVAQDAPQSYGERKSNQGWRLSAQAMR